MCPRRAEPSFSLSNPLYQQGIHAYPFEEKKLSPNGDWSLVLTTRDTATEQLDHLERVVKSTFFIRQIDNVLHDLGAKSTKAATQHAVVYNIASLVWAIDTHYQSTCHRHTSLAIDLRLNPHLELFYQQFKFLFPFTEQTLSENVDTLYVTVRRSVGQYLEALGTHEFSRTRNHFRSRNVVNRQHITDFLTNAERQYPDYTPLSLGLGYDREAITTPLTNHTFASEATEVMEWSRTLLSQRWRQRRGINVDQLPMGLRLSFSPTWGVYWLWFMLLPNGHEDIEKVITDQWCRPAPTPRVAYRLTHSPATYVDLRHRLILECNKDHLLQPVYDNYLIRFRHTLL